MLGFFKHLIWSIFISIREKFLSLRESICHQFWIFSLSSQCYLSTIARVYIFWFDCFCFVFFFIIIFIQIAVICVLLSFFKSTVRQYIIQRVNNKMNVYEVFCFQNFEHIMPYQFPLDSRQIDECIGFKVTFMYLTSYFRVVKDLWL